MKQLAHQPTKAEFHGSLANRRRCRRDGQPAHQPGVDLAVVFRGKDVAHFRAVTAWAAVFLAPFAGKREFSHAAAFILARAAEQRGLRLIRIGEPSLARLTEAAQILRAEVAA